MFCKDNKLSFIKCTQLANDIENEESLLTIIDYIHFKGNRRGIQDPKLIELINKFCNNCKTCIENKYDRKRVNKEFEYTDKPNAIVHLDIFYIQKCYFLTTVDSFTKLGIAHKLNDKNLFTIKTKTEERIAFLGKPE